MISINSIAVLIFASLIIQDVVFCDEQQAVNATTRVQGDGDKGALTVLADDQHQRPENVGKIWNWTFSSAGTHFPTATDDESKPKLKKEQKVSPSERSAAPDANDSNASASGFKKSFLRNAHMSDETAKPRLSVPLRNLERLRDGMRGNSKAPSIERESYFDDDFGDSFDSRDLSFDDDDDDDDDDESQSYGSWQLDDDDDLSDNEFFGRLPQPSRTKAGQSYPTSFSASRPDNIAHPPAHKSVPTVPAQRPAMQVRSVSMQPRSLQMRTGRSPVRRSYAYGRGKLRGAYNSVGM